MSPVQNSQEHWMHHGTFYSYNKQQAVNDSAFRKFVGEGGGSWVPYKDNIGSSVFTLASTS